MGTFQLFFQSGRAKDLSAPLSCNQAVSHVQEFLNVNKRIWKTTICEKTIKLAASRLSYNPRMKLRATHFCPPYCHFLCLHPDIQHCSGRAFQSSVLLSLSLPASRHSALLWTCLPEQRSTVAFSACIQTFSTVLDVPSRAAYLVLLPSIRFFPVSHSTVSATIRIAKRSCTCCSSAIRSHIPPPE
jgi:hypothetical protein